MCDKGVQTIDSTVGIPNFDEWAAQAGEPPDLRKGAAMCDACVQRSVRSWVGVRDGDYWTCNASSPYKC